MGRLHAATHMYPLRTETGVLSSKKLASVDHQIPMPYIWLLTNCYNRTAVLKYSKSFQVDESKAICIMTYIVQGTPGDRSCNQESRVQ